jgi:hypothetical protein
MCGDHVAGGVQRQIFRPFVRDVPTIYRPFHSAVPTWQPLSQFHCQASFMLRFSQTSGPFSAFI